jgi:hypothetical protein
VDVRASQALVFFGASQMALHITLVMETEEAKMAGGLKDGTM